MRSIGRLGAVILDLIYWEEIGSDVIGAEALVIEDNGVVE